MRNEKGKTTNGLHFYIGHSIFNIQYFFLVFTFSFYISNFSFLISIEAYFLLITATPQPYDSLPYF
jgi:hypothetical protein